MDKILQIAVAELGQKEITGPQYNPTIINYAKEAGFTWVDDDETPWCSIFVNWVAKKAGLKASGKANARSWLLEGLNVDTAPEPGDFGNLTETALKLLQSMKTGLAVDGVYNQATKDFLFEVLNA